MGLGEDRKGSPWQKNAERLLGKDWAPSFEFSVRSLLTSDLGRRSKYIHGQTTQTCLMMVLTTRLYVTLQWNFKLHKAL